MESSGYSSKSIMSICASGRGFTVCVKFLVHNIVTVSNLSLPVIELLLNFLEELNRKDINPHGNPNICSILVITSRITCVRVTIWFLVQGIGRAISGPGYV